MFFVSVLQRFQPRLSCIFIMFVQLYIISTVFFVWGGGGSSFVELFIVVLCSLLLFWGCFMITVVLFCNC